MRLTVDREICISSGSCVRSDPAVFDQDEADGRVFLLLETPGPEHRDAVLRAVHSCPAGALTIVEDR
ncbi:ferredoxin [Streptomyces asiaticus]